MATTLSRYILRYSGIYVARDIIWLLSVCVSRAITSLSVSAPVGCVTGASAYTDPIHHALHVHRVASSDVNRQVLIIRPRVIRRQICGSAGTRNKWMPISVSLPVTD